MARIKSINACYTGGGIYFIYGQLTNGNWFFYGTGNERVEIIDSDPSRPHPVQSDWWSIEDMDWYLAHVVETDDRPTLKTMCRLLYTGDKRVMKNEYSNYSSADFCDWHRID